MAARAVAEHVGTEHHEYLFMPEEAFGAVDTVVWHLETYEPELIRSAIPNYFLAKLAGAHVKVVLTGEGTPSQAGPLTRTTWRALKHTMRAPQGRLSPACPVASCR